MININKKIKSLIFIIVILVLFFLGFVRFKNQGALDNFLIFNLYENSKNKKYIFDISAKDIQTQSGNLYSTIELNGLANEKIAPGTNGEFEIILKSSIDTEYQVTFDSKNIKPRNLMFNIKDDSYTYDSLESLEKQLKGKIYKGKNKNICIEWSWNYEVDEHSNIEDTLDGMNIQEYNFDINIFSY